jgi:hypothetical protein
LFVAYSGGTYAGHIKIFRSFMDWSFPAEQARKQYNAIEASSFPKLSGEYHQSRMYRTTSDKLMNLFIGRLRLKTLPEGKISFSLYDMDFSFREVAAGIFKTEIPNSGYPFGPFEYLLTSRSHDGRLMLLTDGPMTYIKARWYETSSVALGIILPAVLLAIVSLLFFALRYLLLKIRRKKSSLSGVAFIMTHAILLLLLIIVSVLANAPHPVHLLPGTFFDPDPVVDFLSMILPLLVAIAGVGVLFSYLRGFSRNGIFFRVYFSVYSLWVAGLIWFFWFNNMLSI